MSFNEETSILENSEGTIGECSVRNHTTSPDGSSSDQEILKEFTYNHENGPNILDDADKAYLILLNVFRFLSTKDLVSATQVCKVWNLVGSDSIFWKRITLNNCIVHDDDVVLRILKKYQPEILDLRGMRFFKDITPLNEKSTDYKTFIKSLLCNALNEPRRWTSFCRALTGVTTLTEVIVNDCPSDAITILAEGLPHLKSLDVCAYWTEFDITPLKKMTDLKTLRIDSKNSVSLIFDESSSEAIEEIQLSLTTLTITRATNLYRIQHILPATLVSLELGEFQSLSYDFSNVILPTLVNLTRLRLEKCFEPQLTKVLLQNISKLPNLSELELVNFDFSSLCMDGIELCTNLKSLLIVPIYKRNDEHKHPLINTIILKFAIRLTKLLEVFVWVISDRLVSQQNLLNIRNKNSLKSVRVIGHDGIPFLAKSSNDFIIQYISFDRIQSLLLPDVKVKIFRIDFSSTWKLSLQNITM